MCMYIYIYTHTIWKFPKMGYPHIINFKSMFHYKPSILRYHPFKKPLEL